MKRTICLLTCCFAAFFLGSSCSKSKLASSYSRKSSITIDGVTWATRNVEATKANPYGAVFTYEKALNVCPDGWRLPTGDEITVLARFRSQVAICDGMRGKWFSGSTPYNEDVEAVFLPFAGADYGNGLSTRGSIGGYWLIDDKYYRFTQDDAIHYTQAGVFEGREARNCAFSVRCVKN